VGRYTADPTPEQLTRYFHLSSTDLAHARRRRSLATQLGYGVQLGTVRFLGTFAPVAGTPRSVVAEIARQLNIDDSEWSRYVASRAREAHQVDIRLEHGYHAFGQDTTHIALLRWLWDRAWTADDSASQLVDLATGWLVEHQVLLPDSPCCSACAPPPAIAPPGWPHGASSARCHQIDVWSCGPCSTSRPARTPHGSSSCAARLASQHRRTPRRRDCRNNGV